MGYAQLAICLVLDLNSEKMSPPAQLFLHFWRHSGKQNHSAKVQGQFFFSKDAGQIPGIN